MPRAPGSPSGQRDRLSVWPGHAERRPNPTGTGPHPGLERRGGSLACASPRGVSERAVLAGCGSAARPTYPRDPRGSASGVYALFLSRILTALALFAARAPVRATHALCGHRTRPTPSFEFEVMRS